MATEKPTYRILKKEGKYELRAYDPYISAQVQINARDHNQAAYRGFSPLANYIFGSNTSREKISMTSPVSAKAASEKIAMTSPVTVRGSENYVVSFVMPKQFTLESLPIPDDERISFVQNPERVIASVHFRGAFRQGNFDKHIHLLRKWIEHKGWRELSEPIIAGYDPPFIPAFLKHNEILIEIEE